MHETMVEYKSKIEKFYWRRQVGERIRETRIKMQLLPKDIEKLVFDEDSQWVSVNRINLIENGRPKKEFWPYIYVEIIPKIAQVLKVSVAWLLSGEENNIKVPVQSSLFKPEAGKEIFKNPAEIVENKIGKKYDVVLEINFDDKDKIEECKQELLRFGIEKKYLYRYKHPMQFYWLLVIVNMLFKSGIGLLDLREMFDLVLDYVNANGQINLYRLEKENNNGKC